MRAWQRCPSRDEPGLLVSKRAVPTSEERSAPTGRASCTERTALLARLLAVKGLAAVWRWGIGFDALLCALRSYLLTIAAQPSLRLHGFT